MKDPLSVGDGARVAVPDFPSIVELGNEIVERALVAGPAPFAMTAIVHAAAIMIVRMDEVAHRNDAMALFVKQLGEQVRLLRFVRGRRPSSEHARSKP